MERALKKGTKKFGQILIDAEMITNEHLIDALHKQKSNGKRVGTILVEMGCISDSAVTRCLAEQYRLPYISLDKYRVKEELDQVIPESVSDRYSVIPLDLVRDILTVGIADVPDEKTVRRLQNITGFKIQTILITPGDFNQHIEKKRFLSSNIEMRSWPRLRARVKTESYSGRERRRFPRYNAELKVKYEFRNEYNINLSINISRCGVLIRSKNPVPLHSDLIIKISLPVAYEDIVVISKVVRVEKREGYYCIALNFGSMDVIDSRKLVEYMKLLYDASRKPRF